MDGSQQSLTPDVRRKRFTGADVLAMIDAGIIREGSHDLELIRGDLLEMSPQGPLHWDFTYLLTRWFTRQMPDELGVAVNGPLRLDDHNEPEPELFVFPANLRVNEVRGPDVELVVEVGHSSVGYDRKVKAPVYSAFGVKHYWAVDVEKRHTLVYRLGEAGYGDPVAVAFDAPLTAPTGLCLVISDLEPKG